MAKRSVVFSLFLVLIFFPAIAEIVTAQTLHDQHKLCEAKSQTYSKLLCKSKLCDRRCISWEKAVHGACHPHFGIDSCYCYFECSQTPSKGKVPPSFGKLPGTPPPAAPPAPPPGAGGLLPPILPPIGGGSPPPPPAPPTPPPGGGGGSPSPPPSPPAGGLLPPLLPPIGDGSKPCKRTKAYV